MSILRARCPDCRTLTAVAIGPDYQCHSCGREFAAGLVRVACSCGAGASVDAELPWPEAAVLGEDDDLAGRLPQRPLVLAGCANVHGAVAAALGADVLRPGSPPPRGRCYVAVDAGALAPDGTEELERLLASLPTPAGAGFSGFGSSPAALEAVARLGHALGL